jgi:AraC-like DNA-binding protein
MDFNGAASLRTLYVRPGLAPNQITSAVIIVSPLLRELIQRATEIRFLDSRQPIHVAMVDLILDELRTHTTPALDLPMPRSASLRRVADHLMKTALNQIPHDALGQRFGLSARTLERGFLKETGLPLGMWRRQARFQSALRALGDGASVKQAATEAGYQSPSAFIAAFRAAFHTTPGRYFDAGRPATASSARPITAVAPP